MVYLFDCTTPVVQWGGGNPYSYFLSNCARVLRVRPRVEIWGIGFRELRIK